MATAQRNKFIWGAVVGGVLLAIVGGLCAFTLPGFGTYEKLTATGGAVSIPTAAVADGAAHFYRYEDGDTMIKLFVVKGADGSYRTAFDACDVCYPAKKGYEQQGRVMVCRNCNRRFPIDRIGPHTTGGCNPSYLPHRLAGSALVITVADLKEGARFF